MKRIKKRVPKSLLIKMLKSLDLTLTRETYMDRRMWKVSDGKYYDSLKSVFQAYSRNPKDKKTYQKIEPFVIKINEAIQ